MNFKNLFIFAVSILSSFSASASTVRCTLPRPWVFTANSFTITHSSRGTANFTFHNQPRPGFNDPGDMRTSGEVTLNRGHYAYEASMSSQGSDSKREVELKVELNSFDTHRSRAQVKWMHYRRTNPFFWSTYAGGTVEAELDCAVE